MPLASKPSLWYVFIYLFICPPSVTWCPYTGQTTNIQSQSFFFHYVDPSGPRIGVRSLAASTFTYWAIPLSRVSVLCFLISKDGRIRSSQIFEWGTCTPRIPVLTLTSSCLARTSETIHFPLWRLDCRFAHRWQCWWLKGLTVVEWHSLQI